MSWKKNKQHKEQIIKKHKTIDLYIFCVDATLRVAHLVAPYFVLQILLRLFFKLTFDMSILIQC